MASLPRLVFTLWRDKICRDHWGQKWSFTMSGNHPHPHRGKMHSLIDEEQEPGRLPSWSSRLIYAARKSWFDLSPGLNPLLLTALFESGKISRIGFHSSLNNGGLLLPLYNDKKEVASRSSGVIRGQRGYFLFIISDIMLSAPKSLQEEWTIIIIKLDLPRNLP